VVSVSDGINPTVEATMLINVEPLPWTQLTSDDFEAGWGNWLDGGNNAMLSSSFAVGSQCLNLQDDIVISAR
jgi:hypothetical protein